jgi:UDP-2,3-diacylglucosamine pyrophosphatase LpxH
VRTLVLSDLHLGNRSRRDVLQMPAIRERLLAAVADARAERVVLLGDIVELMHRQPRRSMVAAEPVLRALGQSLGSDREVVVVPGNHDAPLLRGWALAQGTRLEASHAVPATASPALERLLSWLAPARTRVSYPGVWLADRIWATHGHYLDHHLTPDSAFGLLRRPGHGARAITPMEYERLRRRGGRSRESLPARLTSRPAATVIQTTLESLRVLPRVMLDAGMAPVTAKLLDVQMRRCATPAMARVAAHLGVDADWVLFGHVHRRGPIGDEAWPAENGPARPRMVNTGAWLYEPLLVDRATAPHPYWPGGAVLLEDGQPPRSVGLLDDVGADELHASGPTEVSAG